MTMSLARALSFLTQSMVAFLRTFSEISRAVQDDVSTLIQERAALFAGIRFFISDCIVWNQDGIFQGII
jgi:hypothetical protein